MKHELQLLFDYFSGGNAQGLTAPQIKSALSVVQGYRSATITILSGRAEQFDKKEYEAFGIPLLQSFLLGGGLKGVVGVPEIRKRIEAVLEFSNPISWN